ncbi:uncharacterized protein [Arachis hypogaea]|uniref:uncharacterized protein n=1 Tax=Arachis hypogaea TaxID=3818 RepID=UPI003B21E1BF
MSDYVSSVRVSTQVHDLKQCSTKKVKDREEIDLNKKENSIEMVVNDSARSTTLKKISYKETLLSSPGDAWEGNIMDVVEEEPNPEDRWYIDMEAQEKENKAFDPCPTIPVSKDEFDEWCKPSHAALIVKVLGKRVSLGFMEQRLNRDWVKKGKINVIDMDRDYFLVHFSDEENYSHALLDGPWMIAGHYLIVQRWRPFFLTSESAVKKIAAWVRILNLPIELYNHRFLWRIRSAIGTMLKIDRATSIHSRGRFARICIEIDLTKKLVPRISVLGSTLNIEYEGLHLICFQCGKYGHRNDQCSEVAVRVEGSPKVGNAETPVEEKEGPPEGSSTGNLAIQSKCANQGVNCAYQAPPDFGPWMMVKRSLRKNKKEIYDPGNKSKVNTNGPHNNDKENRGDMNQGSEDGSRFNVLIDGGADTAQDISQHDKLPPKVPMQSGPPTSQAQTIVTKSIMAKERFLKKGASKNPQAIIKGPTTRIGPILPKKGFKLKQKIIEKAPLAFDSSAAVMPQNKPSTSKDPYKEDLEQTIMANMRDMVKHQ